MKLVKIGLCSLGLVGAVVSVNAAPQSPDQGIVTVSGHLPEK